MFLLFDSDVLQRDLHSFPTRRSSDLFADGSSAIATVTLTVPTIASVSPSSGAPGASLTVSVTGTNFQAGASASFGAGVTEIGRAHVWTPHPWRALTLSTTATKNPRDVTVSN